MIDWIVAVWDYWILKALTDRGLLSAQYWDRHSSLPLVKSSGSSSFRHSTFPSFAAVRSGAHISPVISGFAFESATTWSLIVGELANVVIEAVRNHRSKSVIPARLVTCSTVWYIINVFSMLPVSFPTVLFRRKSSYLDLCETHSSLLAKGVLQLLLFFLGTKSRIIKISDALKFFLNILKQQSESSML